MEYQTIMQKLEALNRKKDVVCLILSYAMKEVNKDRHEAWIHDILKINRRARNMNEGKIPEAASELDHEINQLLDHKMDDIESYVSSEMMMKLCEKNPEVETTSTMPTGIETILSAASTASHGNINPVPEVVDLAVGFATEQILKNIKDPQILRTGISGRDGARVLSELTVRPQIKQMPVLHIPGSSYSSVKALEDIIAAAYFRFSTSDTATFNDLMKNMSFFILLEDVPQGIELHRLGAEWWNYEKIQKIVSTTRFQQVHQGMAVDLEIRLEDHFLPWELFCANIGRAVHAPRIQPWAVVVAKACGSHLLAIIVIARALKDVDDVLAWEDAYHSLRLQCPTQVEDKVLFNAVAFSWEHLDLAMKLATYCAFCMKREGISKVDLIQELFRGSLIGTVDEGEKIIEDLINAFLLDSFQNGDSLQMRDEIREVLKMFVSEKNPRFLRLSGKELTEPPYHEAWKEATRIDLVNGKLSQLPESPNCPQLRRLYLQMNLSLRQIPSLFFVNMPSLQTLDLSNTRINTLPPSLFKLDQLRHLSVRCCELLMELPPKVGELKNLQVLDVEGTEIITLPMEVGKLTNLQCLKVSFYGYNHEDGTGNNSNAMVPRNVIANLVQLTELSIDVNPDDERWNTTVKYVIREVYSLKQLKSLKLYLPEMVLLAELMGDGALSTMYLSFERFRLIVGSHLKSIISRLPHEIAGKFEQEERRLKYVNGGKVPDEFKKALQHATALFIDRHSTATSLSEFGIENMKKLEFCALGECNRIETVIDGTKICELGDDGDTSEESILGSLCYLGVNYMKSLRSIWKGPIDKPCLSNLKSLALYSCPQLISIFPLALLKSLNALEELVVQDCPEIVSLVNRETDEIHSSPDFKFLPRLKKISLHYMPKLVNISAGLRIAPELEWISFYGCHSLKTLSMGEVSINFLKVIVGEEGWWSALEWRGLHSEIVATPIHLANVFVHIKRDRDLSTQLAELSNHPQFGKQEKKPSQKTGMNTAAAAGIAVAKLHE